MRKVLFVIAILSLAFGVAGAKDFQKYGCGELITFHNSGDRVGGDDMATATVIPGLPYSDIGNTSAFTNLYDVACPYTGSTAPEVVYSFEAVTDWTVDVTLCNASDFDTKLYISDSLGNVVGCIDDVCPGYQSELIGVSLAGGDTYFFFVDGYGTAAGNYSFDIDGTPGTVPPEPGETCETALVAIEGTNFAPFQTCYFTYTTSTEPGTLVISSCLPYQTVDTSLYVLDACEGTVVAESDDDNLGCGEAGTFNFASTVSFEALPLTTYVLFWDGYWSTAEFDFVVQEWVGGVANDDTSFGAVKAMFR